jgi:hypothetical protein
MPAADDREAMLHALTVVNAFRSDFEGDIPFEGADPSLAFNALAAVAARALDEVDDLGGDSAGLLRAIYTWAAPVSP